MHASAWDFVRRVVQSLPPAHRVVEFGSRCVNGTVKEIFTDSSKIGGRYIGVDVVPGPNVDVVQDAATWEGAMFDMVVCCEVFEHAPNFGKICESAFLALRPGGAFIVTCATDPREPHSADGDGPPKKGEYYHNVGKGTLTTALETAGFGAVLIDNSSPPGDLYAVAFKAR